MLGRDELEVDGMNNGPYLPRTLAGTQQVTLNFVTNGGEGVAIDKSKVGEEDRHEDRTPHDLINTNLGSDRLSISTLDLGVKPVVEVMARWSMVDETEEGKSKETLHVEGASTDESLSKEISKSPTDKTGESLGGQRIVIKTVIVCLPSRNGSSTGEGRITEKRTGRSSILIDGVGESRLVQYLLGHRRIRRNSKSLSGKA